MGAGLGRVRALKRATPARSVPSPPSRWAPNGELADVRSTRSGSNQGVEVRVWRRADVRYLRPQFSGASHSTDHPDRTARVILAGHAFVRG